MHRFHIFCCMGFFQRPHTDIFFCVQLRRKKKKTRKAHTQTQETDMRKQLTSVNGLFSTLDWWWMHLAVAANLRMVRIHNVLNEVYKNLFQCFKFKHKINPHFVFCVKVIVIFCHIWCWKNIVFATCCINYYLNTIYFRLGKQGRKISLFLTSALM